MLRELLLVALLSSRSTHGEYFPCEPEDVKLITSGQTIMVTWADAPTCGKNPVEFQCKLVVFVGDQQAHTEELLMAPFQNGSTHHWNWTSYLPLKCVSHSVQLTYQYQNLTSRQKQAQTDPGLGSLRRSIVLPEEHIFKVGTRATFCCVIPETDTFGNMSVSGNNEKMSMNVTQISKQTLVLRIDLNEPSIESGDNILCDSSDNDSGACAFVGYPPQMKDLTCETQDLQSVVCRWTKQRNTNVEHQSRTVYHLQGKSCLEAASKQSCSQRVRMDDGMKNWTLKAENVLGSMVLTDEADLRKRVHMSPAEVRTFDVNARNVSLRWWWKFHIYSTLNVTCQITLGHPDAHLTDFVTGVGRNHATLSNLTPNMKHRVQVRCGTAQHFWKWSEWSSPVEFRTKGDVPDALDVWMQQSDNKLLIVWKKPQARQSHGEVLDYEVTWAPLKSPDVTQRLTFPPSEHSTLLALDPREEFIINVTVRNNNGSSTPSTLTTPVSSPEMVSKSSSQVRGLNGSLHVSWTASPLSSCGYIVDWLPVTSQHGKVEWLKKPPNVTSAEITSDKLEEGVRYLISIYACSPGTVVGLEGKEGYIKEKRIEAKLFNLKWKQMDEEVTVSWDPIDFGAQTAFITGYKLYCSRNEKIIAEETTEDPTATSLTVRKLPIASYTFTVMARTEVGECGASSISATLDTLTDKLIVPVVITLVSVSVLLVLASVLCFRNWRRIKQKLFPPIPKPALKGGFGFLAEGNPYAAFAERCLQSVEPNFEVSLLHLKREAETRHCLPPADNDYLAVIPSTMEQLLNLSYHIPDDSEDQLITAPLQTQAKSVGGFDLQQALEKARADPNHLTCCDSAYISAPM